MMKQKESKEDRFRRLAEARVNKILHLFRLLGNLSLEGHYDYTAEQVATIFGTLQLELAKTRTRFFRSQKKTKKRFSLNEPYDVEAPVVKENNPAFAIPLPDGTYLRAVGFSNSDFPCINIYWDNGINEPTEPLSFVEFNPEKEGAMRVCIGVYRSDEEDTVYYAPYVAAERTTCNE